VRERCDLLVIPSSNQANGSSDFSARADLVEGANLPCLAVGLGAQAPAGGTTVTFKPGTKRYLRAVAQRTKTIGVRGEFTAEVLARAGIRNTVVIGCPSHFINPAPDLGASIERKLRRGEFARFSVTAGDLDAAHQALERKLFGWLLEREGYYVCQSVQNLIAVARHRFEEVREEEIGEMAEYLLGDAVQPATFREICRERFGVFFSAVEWMAAMAPMDLVAGPRFHGNQLAMQAGTPGICVHHDARTEELVKTMRLPGMVLEDAVAVRSLQEMVERAGFEGAGYDARRAELAGTYTRLLAENGITPSAQLMSLVGRESMTRAGAVDQ
jgi:hypothetical protein